MRKNMVMILRGKDIYSSTDETSSKSEEFESEHNEDAYPCEGDLVMIRRTLKDQPSLQLESQRENIFRTRCKILENTCSLIVDSGSWRNFFNTRLVENLNLIVILHPKSYSFIA